MSIRVERQNLLFVLSAPSGGGKSTLCRRLLESDSDLAYSVSTTTRPKRAGEVEGVAYNFVSVEEFDRLRREGAFVESATVHDHLYGTRRDLIERTLAGGRDVLMDVDVQGAASIRRVSERAVLIFVLPPSMRILEERLRRRESDGEEAIRRRLATAREEIARAAEFDYVVLNDSLDDAVAETRGIIRAERRRLRNVRIVCEGEGDLRVGPSGTAGQAPTGGWR